MPSDTKSYAFQDNLASSAYIKPYVNGIVENASYYFTTITPRKKYELDLLLLTQGWSSYDWNTIFNHPPDYKFNFERGISLTATQNGSAAQQFFLYPSANSASALVGLENGKNSFIQKELLPITGEEIRIGAITAKGEMKKPSLYTQFTPATIPPLVNQEIPYLQPKTAYNLSLIHI